MLELILRRLTGLLPPPTRSESAQAWTNEDYSWHSSSFELARGLEVIEHPGVPGAVFADTLPAFHPPKA